MTGRKGKAFRNRVRRVSDDELLSSFDQSLTTLQHLARTYDNGYAPIALVMATEVQKILTENAAATRLRGSRTFLGPDQEDNRNVISALHKLTIARVGGMPPELTFVPSFYADGGRPSKSMPFKDWWNNDIIYRASAAIPGTSVGMIPVNDSPSVPYDERERMSRRMLVSLLRNSLGAHQASEMPGILDDLQDSHSWGAFAVQTPAGILSTDDGSLPTTIGIIPAMMRQICHELLIAYGRSDPPPS